VVEMGSDESYLRPAEKLKRTMRKLLPMGSVPLREDEMSSQFAQKIV
jgi:hypothetical protein